MALHFEREEYAARLESLTAQMREEKLGAMLDRWLPGASDRALSA